MGVVQCCYERCAHRICFDDAVEADLRRTHEWWYCPVGHQQHFTSKTREEKRIAELERDVARLEDDRQYWFNRIDEERDRAAGARRIARTCPLCGTVFRTPRRLPEHLIEAHGAEAFVVEAEPVAAVPS